MLYILNLETNLFNLLKLEIYGYNLRNLLKSLKRLKIT